MIFPAKLLLFGEHIIMQGAKALAIPWPAFSGKWRQEQDTERQQLLPQCWSYLQDLQDKNEIKSNLNLNQFKADLQSGLYFDSNIPLGYGAGSSGALCAAILKRYEVDPASKRDLILLKEQLGQIESFFHGASSGIDPLISYLNRAILIDASGKIKELEKAPTLNNPYQLFVIDTLISRKTGPLVEAFIAKAQQEAFNIKMKAELISTSDQAIDALINGQSSQLFFNFDQICSFQWNYMKEMIPQSFHMLWTNAVHSDQFKVKICGAGGGGFILGLSRTPFVLEKLSKEYKIRFLN